MSYPDARALLRKYGLRAKKSWGQNFLVDERALDSIVRASGAGPEDVVVEIGAGLGTLTARLGLSSGRVVAIERDRDMAHILREELCGHERIEIAEANALTFDWAEAAKRAGRPLIVVGNLPYQIASPLLFRLLEARAHLARMVVMLQLEMAERIVAAPATADYGALSVMIRIQATPRIAFRLPPGAFHPPPRVHSAVLVIEPLASPRAPITDEGWFSDVVHAAFGQRRKTLRNALGTMVEDEPIGAALAATGIDGQRRGETLTVEEFAALSEALLRAAAGRRRPDRPARGARAPRD